MSDASPVLLAIEGRDVDPGRLRRDHRCPSLVRWTRGEHPVTNGGAVDSLAPVTQLGIPRSRLFTLERQIDALLTATGDLTPLAREVATIAQALPAGSQSREGGHVAARALSAEELTPYRRSAGLRYTVTWLRELHRDCTFAAESTLDDPYYSAFLRAAVSEDERLVGSEALPLTAVARRSKLDFAVIDLAAARAFDERVLYFSGLDARPYAVLLEHDELKALIAELPATPGAQQLPQGQMTTTSPPQQIDVGILTIKDEEFSAVLDAFPDDEALYVGPKSRRHYNLRSAKAGNGARYRIAIVRQIEQGTGEAQSVARDMLEELEPLLILVVGIARGVPSEDFTLGDVVLSYLLSGIPLCGSILGW